MSSTAELRKRLIRRADLIANDVAFIDYRIPGCTPKHNYALIGPGVAQGTRQFVNLQEPHGFNLGAVNVPHGITNPPHLHFTAEVFICFRGDWAVQWGAEGENEARIAEGDLVSVPPWIYRGFRNVGVDDGFLFTVLGRDHPGGILWAPHVVKAGQDNGLYLTDDNRIIDTAVGEKLGPNDRLFEPMAPGEISTLRGYSAAQMEQLVVRHRDLRWSTRALLGAIDAGVALAPAIGYGTSEDRTHGAPVMDRSGFSIEWLRLAPGATLARHRLDEKQVLVALSGRAEMQVDDGTASASIPLGPWDTYSMPARAWRSIRNAAEGDCVLLLVTPGDGRKCIEWSDEAIATAKRAGWALDPNGTIAPARYVAHRTAVLSRRRRAD
jgi:quercetin dioxygenase-like cupin family protein